MTRHRGEGAAWAAMLIVTAGLLAACAAPPSRPASEPVPPTTAARTTAAPEAAATITVTAIGDSITEAVGWTGIRPQEQWLALLAERLGETSLTWGRGVATYPMLSGSRVTIVNAGIGGDTTDEMYARLEGALNQRPADVCIIFGGSNDIQLGLPAERTRDNLSGMVRRCKAADVVPVMATVPPRTEMSAAQRRDTLALNAWIRAYAAEQGITCADFFAALEYPPGSAGLPMDAPDHTDDGVHPSVEGHRAMAAVIDLAPFRKALGD